MLDAFDLAALHKIGKRELYAKLYGSIKPLQQRIDEEGCGAVFAAVLPGQLYGNQN